MNIAEHRLRHKPAHGLAVGQSFPNLTGGNGARVCFDEAASESESVGDAERTTGACDDGEGAEPGQAVHVSPTGQIRQRVGSDDKKQFRGRVASFQFRDGLDGVGWAAASYLDVIGLELVAAVDGQLHHAQPVGRRDVSFERFVGWHGGGDEFHEVQIERFQSVLCNEQMPDVDRVEGAAEQSYPCVAFHWRNIILTRMVNSTFKLVPRVKRFRYAVETAGFRLAMAVLPHLSLRAIRRLARWLGWAAYHLAGKARRIALANLDVVFGETKSLAEKKRIARCSMENLTATILTLPWSRGLTAEKLREVVELDAGELARVREVLGRGKGIVCATLHYGNWELLALAAGHHGLPMNIVADFSRNRRLGEMIRQLRAGTGNRIIPQRGAAPKLLRALRRGEIVVLIIDQNAPEEGGGEWLEFFGLPAFNNVLAAALVVRTGAALFSCHSVPLPDGRLRLVYGPQIPYSLTGHEDADVRRISQQCLDHFEELIRRRPEFWLWVYKRWKHRRDPDDPRYPFYTSEKVFSLPRRASQPTNAHQIASVPANNVPPR